MLRFASTSQLDPAFDTALAILKQKGAILVDIKKFDDKAVGKGEDIVLHTELKADIANILRTAPQRSRARSLGDLIAFNNSHAEQEMTLFGQDYFEGAEKTKGIDDRAYKKAREMSFRAAGPNGIDKMLKQHDVVALVGPTPPRRGRSTP